jgi:hypothetical protein
MPQTFLAYTHCRESTNKLDCIVSCIRYSLSQSKLKQYHLKNTLSTTKLLAFAAVAVKPEPRGWPGKATLRPVYIE